MKKIITFFTLIITLIFGFAFLSNTLVKATGENDGKTVTTVGAAIRTAEPAGLKFAGEVSEAFVGTEVKYGFVLTKGSVNKAEILDRLAASNAIEKEVDGLDGDNRFYLTIVNIPAKGYANNITALAYVDVDGEKIYADSAITRNIQAIADAAVEGGNDNEYIVRIHNTSTFNLNGGELSGYGTFTVGAFNSGSTGTSGVTLCTYASRNSGSGTYWRRVTLKRTGLDSHLFTIVENVASGGSLTKTNSDDFDYIIAGHEGHAADYSLVTALGSNMSNYVYISSFANGAVVKYSTDADLLLGNRLSLVDGNALPSTARNYYTFDGWYGNVGLTGDAITTKSGNSAETFYAKWTPVNYTLTYDLQGGKVDGNSSLDSVAFTVESAAIALPIASRMSRTDYTFVEWNTRSDGTGDALTALPAGSHSNTTVYAIWESNAPIEVDLTSADSTLIAEISANKFVKPEFTAGRFTIAGNTYTVGTELFSTISAAIASASANDKIYVFPGTYANNLTIGTSNLTIVGSNGLLELTHSSTFNEAATNNAIISGTVTVSSATANTTIRGFLLKGKVTLSGVNGLTMKNCVLSAGSTDGAVTVDAASSSLVFDHIYQLGSGARCFYMKANINGFDMQNCAVLDAATVSLGGSNNIDFIRFGASYESQVYGTVVFSNNYVRSAQSGFYVRNAKCNATTTTFTIENNYFYKTPAAVYLGGGSYAPASGTTVNYNISKNTFIDCGSKANDWDVIVVCSAAKTDVQIHYNAFIDSFKTNTGSKTDYVIKVRTVAGTISCSNNYFEGATGPISNVLNATGVSQLDTSTSTTTANAYEDYTVVKISSQYYIYGVNLSQED